jgi:hypothetical protein
MDLRPLRPALGALRTRIRGLYLLHGLGRVAAVFAGLLLLSFLLDLLLQPPRGVRIVHALLSLAALAWSVHRFLVLPMRRSLVDLSDEELALAVEARVPSLQDRLAGALQWERILADPECGESEAFMQASVAEAAVAVARVRAADLTDARGPRRSLAAGGAAAAAFVLTIAVAHDAAAVWARRSLLLLDETWPRRTNLVVLGFDPASPRVITLGDDLAVSVRVDGVVPEAVTLHFQTIPAEGGRVDRDAQSMLQSAEDPRAFTLVFHEVAASFQFWVIGGDDDDGEPRFTVRALVPPSFEEIAADLAFPPSTGLLPERRTEGDLEVPAGTIAKLTVKASVPLRSAALAHPADTPPKPLVVDPDGRTVRFEAEIRETADWRLDMVGIDGAKSSPSRTTRRFTALPDPRPQVRLLHPASRIYAVADARIPVKLRATDNYGLEKVALEVVPGRGAAPVEIPLASLLPAAIATEGAPVPRLRESLAYRLLDLPDLWAGQAEKTLPQEDEVVLKGIAADNGGSTAATEPVVIQITDVAEMLRRLSQRQTRVREDLESLRRHLEEARQGARRARDALAGGGALTPEDRDALRGPGGMAARAVRESAGLADSLGDVLLTYCWNRLLDNRVAADRVVALSDEWLREDHDDPQVVFKPALWRRLAGAHASRDIDDTGILGSLLGGVGLSDRLATGPSPALRDRLESLSSARAENPAEAAAAAVKAADDALALVREIGLCLQDWETLHEILEATRSIMDQQGIIRDRLKGAATPAPQGR